jgi:hypothetical protein
MDNMYDTFSDYFHTIYKKTTYLDKYGGSTIITTIILFTFFSLISYYFIQSNIKPIQQDWINQRCKPNIMPFAGMINAPKGESVLDYTNENFINCTTSVLSKIVEYFTQPLYYISDLLSQFYVVILDTVNKVRVFLFYLRTKLTKIFEYMISRVLNVMVPVQLILIKMKDLLNKINGTMVAGLMAVYGAYLTLKSFVGAFLQICIVILIIIAAAVILLWILPFTWPAAAAGSVFFLLISIPIALIIHFMSEILNVHPSNKGDVPEDPGCFDKSTLIQTQNGYTKISHLKVGEILKDGSKIDAIFKISTRNRNMYTLNEVIVSGSHKIFHKKLGWINISEHPDAKLMYNYKEPIIFCLNTSSKRIYIKDMIFMDWDELTPTDMMKLKLMKYIPMKGGFENVHKYMESGFDADTILETINGKKIKIKDIRPDDILVNGEQVISTVEIDSRDLENIQQYTFGNMNIIGGPNIFMKHKDLGNLSTLGFKGKKVNRNHLYHLITDTESFRINNICVKDYNSAIENVLDIRDKLSMLF